MPKCTICKTEKPLEEFYKKTRTQYRSDCKECHKTVMRPRSREHYAANKAYYLSRNRKLRKRLAKFIREYKQSNPTCADCKLGHPYYRLDFDHLPGSDKKMILSKAANLGWTERRLMLEISKCELVCANCHRDRTFSRWRAHVDSNDAS